MQTLANRVPAIAKCNLDDTNMQPVMNVHEEGEPTCHMLCEWFHSPLPQGILQICSVHYKGAFINSSNTD